MSDPARSMGVTRWVEEPSGGRRRGPRGLGRAWVEVLVRPRRFFRHGVAAGDQAPALTFAITVAIAAVGGRLILDPSSLSGYARVADATGSTYLSAAIVLGVAAVLVTPLVLHLAAALETLALRPLVAERAGVSETVQVLAYAAAPAVFVAVPRPTVQVLALGYATVLLAVGTTVVHETTPIRGTIAAALPAAFVFGAAFGGIGAMETLLAAR